MKKTILTMLTALLFASGAWASSETITLSGGTTKDSKTTAMVPTIASSNASITLGTAASTCATEGYIISTADEKTAVLSSTTYYLCQPYQSGSKKYWKDAGANIYGTFTIPSGYTYTLKNVSHALAAVSSSNFSATITVKDATTTKYTLSVASVASKSSGATISATSVAIAEANWVTLSAGTYTINVTPSNTADASTGKYFGLAQVVLTGEFAAVCTSVSAPTGLSCTAHTKNSLTFGWTAAANASKYTATLYSDAECTSEVTSTSNIDGTSVTFSTLSGATTYYCKVQSNGTGGYCAEGGVTDAESGTTDAKDHTVTAATNNVEWGSAASSAGSLDEDETATITATPKSGYKFVSWSVTGTDAELSSTTTNPTTLTMGTADATVTATFRALDHYTITYNKGDYGSGDAIANGNKTEDVAFTLSSSTYTRAGYIQTGWALTDGGAKAHELGGTYTGNANLGLYPVWVLLQTQRTVSTAETWDWSEATGSNVNLDNTTTPAKDADADIVAANFDGERYAYNCGFPSNFDAIVMYKFQRPKNGSYYQGQTIKIKTSVPGTIAVTFANTGNKRPNRYLSVNGTIHGEGSGDEESASQKTVTVPVAAGDITLTGIYEPTKSNYSATSGYAAYEDAKAGTAQYLNYYKIVFIPAHERTVASGKYATVCLPRAIVSAEGIDKFYTVAGYRGTADDITSVVLAEAETPLTAGKPYIFRTSAAAQTIYLKGDAVNAPVSGENGLVGRFTDGTITDNDCSYILRNNEVCKVDGDEVTCVANRAYFNFYGLDAYAGAPGRFIEIPMAPNNGTDINNIEAAEDGVKFIQDGKLYIKKDGVIYNALGQIVR